MQLDAVNWQELEHAYGTAADVPALIDAVGDRDPVRRARAQELLEAGPFHQQTYYSCLPPMVPLLVEKLQSCDAEGRAWILGYVARITPVKSWFLAPRLEDIPPILHGSIHDERQSAAPIAFAVLARAREYLPTYLACLTDQAARVRAAAVGLVVRFEDARDDVMPRLFELLATERDRETRAVICYVLGVCAPGPGRAKLEARALDDTEDSLVRLAAVFGLIAGRATDVVDEVVAVAAKLLDEPAVVDELCDLVEEPIAHFIPRAALLSVLEDVPPIKGQVFFRPLLRRLKATAVGSTVVLGVLEKVAFGTAELPAEARAHAVGPVQRELLDAVLHCQETYGLGYTLIGGIETRGAEDTKAFLSGRRPARPSECA